VTAQIGLTGFDDLAKSQEIILPDGYLLRVDWDDMDHAMVAASVQRVIAILRDHWDDPAYASIVPMAWDSINDYEVDEEAAAEKEEARRNKAAARIMRGLVLKPARQRR